MKNDKKSVVRVDINAESTNKNIDRLIEYIKTGKYEIIFDTDKLIIEIPTDKFSFLSE